MVTLKVTGLMPPPSLPVGRVETAFPGGKWKGKGKAVQGGDDDRHDLSAQFIVQRVSEHSMLPEIHSADLRHY